jgi:hypothetical protein
VQEEEDPKLSTQNIRFGMGLCEKKDKKNMENETYQKQLCGGSDVQVVI